MECYFKRVARVSETQSQRLPVSADSNSCCSLSDFQSACSESPAQSATSTQSSEEVGLASVSSDPLTFPGKPHQPRLTSFPVVAFGSGSKRRSFQANWFDKWPWLHWNDSLESIFCHVCIQASRAGLIRTKISDQAFISRGFKNWNDATRIFRTHELSLCHKETLERVVTLPSTTNHVRELLSSTLGEDRKRNRSMLLHVLGAVRYLGRQGLAFRGSNLSNEVNSNFSQLLHLLSQSDEQLSSWLKKKTNKYTSTAPDIQNEIIKTMSLIIL